MYTKYSEKIRNFFNTIMAIIIIVGFIGGLFAGSAFMGPTAENIQNATEYPELYGEQIYERHWNTSSSLVASIIWVSTILAVMYLYIKKLSLEMINELIRLNGGENIVNDEEEKYIEPEVSETSEVDPSLFGMKLEKGNLKSNIADNE